MKIIVVKAYAAEDGTEFETAEACRAYEQGLLFRPLVGLTAEQIHAAVYSLEEADQPLGEAVIELAEAIKRQRLVDGRVQKKTRGPRKPKEPAVDAPAGETASNANQGGASTVNATEETTQEKGKGKHAKAA